MALKLRICVRFASTFNVERVAVLTYDLVICKDSKDCLPIHYSIRPSELPIHDSIRPAELPIHDSIRPSELPIHDSIRPAELPIHDSIRPSELLIHNSIRPSELPIHDSIRPSELLIHDSIRPAELHHTDSFIFEINEIVMSRKFMNVYMLYFVLFSNKRVAHHWRIEGGGLGLPAKIG